MSWDFFKPWALIKIKKFPLSLCVIRTTVKKVAPCKTYLFGIKCHLKASCIIPVGCPQVSSDLNSLLLCKMSDNILNKSYDLGTNWRRYERKPPDRRARNLKAMPILPVSSSHLSGAFNLCRLNLRFMRSFWLFTAMRLWINLYTERRLGLQSMRLNGWSILWTGRTDLSTRLSVPPF